MIGCMECVDGSDDCVRCIDDGNWQLVNGKCVCAVGAGTYAASPAPSGFLGGAMPATCGAREFNPILNGPLAPQQCNSANARVMALTYLDPANCTCRRCPNGWTSLGGDPGATPCFDPSLEQQLVGLDLLVQASSAQPSAAPGGRQLTILDNDTLSEYATMVFDAFINVLTEQPDGLSSSLTPVGDVSRVGEVLYAGSVGPSGESRIFRANIAFRAAPVLRDAVIATINAVNPGPTYCTDFLAFTGWDLCQALAEVDPKIALIQLQAYEAALPPVGNPFSVFVGVAGFISKIFVNSGKVYDQKVQKKFAGEGIGLLLDNVLQIFGLANLFTSDDKYLPYFNEINQTTHEASTLCPEYLFPPGVRAQHPPLLHVFSS
jgi:hypothetical protein